MARLFKFVVVLLVLAGAYFGYRHFTGGGHGPGGMEGGMPPAQVSTLKVESKDVPVEFEYVGQVAGSREVEVRARVTGIIEKRLYEEGQYIKAGEKLFKIDPAPYAAAYGIAKAGLAQAQARASQAEREYNRIAPLMQTQAISKKELDDAQSALELARAEVESAKASLDQARINLGYTDVTAPISGVAGRALKVEGSLANAAGDSLLTTMAQVNPAYINFSIPEAEHMRLRQEIADGQVVMNDDAMMVTLKTAEGVALPQKGKVDFNDYKTDLNTATFAMRATVVNEDKGLAPGQFVKVTLNGLTRKHVVTVPQRAVMENPAGKFVYLAGKDDKGNAVALPQPIKVGEWVRGDNGENNWIVYEGLQDGMEIIVDGTARIFFPGAPIVVGQPQDAAPPAEGAAAPAPEDAAPSAETPAQEQEATPSPMQEEQAIPETEIKEVPVETVPAEQGEPAAAPEQTP